MFCHHLLVLRVSFFKSSNLEETGVSGDLSATRWCECCLTSENSSLQSTSGDSLVFTSELQTIFNEKWVHVIGAN